METIFREINKASSNGRRAALCIVVSTKGSVPRRPGAKMLVYEDGSIQGSIGGGNLEKQAIKDALCVLDRGKPELFRHDLLQHHGMCCGGTVNIYIEPMEPVKKLYIFGAGHTGKALAELAEHLDFDIYLIDDRKEYLDQVVRENINKMNLPYEQALNALPFNDHTYVVILTYSHPVDREILAYCLKQPFAYLGMIGSQRKIELTRKNFVEAGIATEEQMDVVDMPIGVDIHAETAEEIAVSILARLISVKNSIQKKV